MFISRSEIVWRLVWHKEFMKVRRLLKGKCFKSEKSNLEGDTLSYRKPVQVFKDRCDVISTLYRRKHNPG